MILSNSPIATHLILFSPSGSANMHVIFCRHIINFDDRYWLPTRTLPVVLGWGWGYKAREGDFGESKRYLFLFKNFLVCDPHQPVLAPCVIGIGIEGRILSLELRPSLDALTSPKVIPQQQQQHKRNKMAGRPCCHPVMPLFIEMFL